MQERYGLKPAAVAIYPMYRGIAKLRGDGGSAEAGRPRRASSTSSARTGTGSTTSSSTTSTPTPLARTATGPARSSAIEDLDAVIPALRELGPDVIVVTGDHSTPSQMAAHSWHPGARPDLGRAGGTRRGDLVRRAGLSRWGTEPASHQGPHAHRPGLRRPVGQVRRLMNLASLIEGHPDDAVAIVDFDDRVVTYGRVARSRSPPAGRLRRARRGARRSSRSTPRQLRRLCLCLLGPGRTRCGRRALQSDESRSRAAPGTGGGVRHHRRRRSRGRPSAGRCRSWNGAHQRRRRSSRRPSLG